MNYTARMVGCLLCLTTFSLECQSTLATPPDVPTSAPESVGMDSQHLDRIDNLVAQSIASNQIPGCVILITRHGKTVFHRAYGHRQTEPDILPMRIDTVFDMASITKPVATATSILLLVERGNLRIHDKFGRYIDAFNQNDKDDVTIFEMLTHQAGFVPDNPLSEYSDPDRIWPLLWQQKLKYPPTTKFVYSDVGFQMLGKLVEHQSGQSLNAFTRANIFEPLGMAETGFLPNAQLRARAAPTERRDDSWMQGEVHDPRSYAMGGVAGHAGLFSTAADLARYAQMILGQGEYAGIRVLSPQTIVTMHHPHTIAGKDQRALGWDVRSRYSTNRGELMTERAVGHGGFTGTAMWIDPGLDLAVIFLSNRVHPDGKGSANHLAGRVCSLAAAAIREPANDAPATAVTVPNSSREAKTIRGPVLTGIDVLVREEFSQLSDQRIGLITNHTGINRDGLRTVDLLHQSANTDLRMVFSPEHGIHGVLDAKIGDARDEATDLPVFSLYGESRSPSQESLDQVDTLVFDIQDIGTRFYTYISTMLNAMRAAADAGKRFVVLDRPNPLGGINVAGPVLDDGKQSFVGCHTISVQHGMTVGELAELFKAELGLDLDLEIIQVENWSRDMLWDQTGLLWVNPSPNMRSWNEALLYPGIGLLETTNLSVGRGTDRPFEIIGAPYIKPMELAAALNAAQVGGLRFVPRFITPNASKFKDERCGAVDIIITDREKVRPVEAGLTLAATLRHMYPTEWQVESMDRLLCDDVVLSMIRSGDSPAAITAEYQDELSAFQLRRHKWLLYQ